MLPADTLRGIIEEFVLREGTEYGYGQAAGSESARSNTLQMKVAQVLAQIEGGDVLVLYDEQTETCNLVARGSKEQLAASNHTQS